MLKKLLDTTLFVYLAVLSIVTVIGLLAVWDIMDEEILIRSMSTMGIITLAAIIVALVTRGIPSGDRHQAPAETSDMSSNQ